MPKEPVMRSEVLNTEERANIRMSFPKIRSIGLRLCSPADRVINEFIPIIQQMRKMKQMILERDLQRKEAGTISDRMFNASYSKHSVDLKMLQEIEATLFVASDALENAVELIQRYVGS